MIHSPPKAVHREQTHTPKCYGQAVGILAYLDNSIPALEDDKTKDEKLLSLGKPNKFSVDAEESLGEALANETKTKHSFSHKSDAKEKTTRAIKIKYI